MRFDGTDQKAVSGQVNPLVRLEPCHVGLQRGLILLLIKVFKDRNPLEEDIKIVIGGKVFVI